jgi:hypothetical protein
MDTFAGVAWPAIAVLQQPGDVSFAINQVFLQQYGLHLFLAGMS